MSAPEWREAASLMRERAMNAGIPPWRAEGKRVVNRDQYAKCADERTAAHIASWHPAVAFAVATWLDSEADRLADLTHAIPNVVVSDGVLREWGFGHALDVARAYLGGAA